MSQPNEQMAHLAQRLAAEESRDHPKAPLALRLKQLHNDTKLIGKQQIWGKGLVLQQRVLIPRSAFPAGPIGPKCGNFLCSRQADGPLETQRDKIPIYKEITEQSKAQGVLIKR